MSSDAPLIRRAWPARDVPGASPLRWWQETIETMLARNRNRAPSNCYQGVRESKEFQDKTHRHILQVKGATFPRKRDLLRHIQHCSVFPHISDTLSLSC